MTFADLDRALDYLSGQNPGKMLLIHTTGWQGVVQAYHVQFYSPKEVYTPVSPGQVARVVHLEKLYDGEWELKVT